MAAPSPAFSPAQRAQMLAATEKTREIYRFPGLSAGIWVAGNGQFLTSVGRADRRTHRPMRARDAVRIGSITKTFTATVVLQLVQRGELRLGDPLSKFVRGIPAGPRITIKELLNHTSGIPDISNHQGDLILAHPRRHWSLNRLIRGAVRQPRYCAPGACWHYSNTNYLLLGKIAELLTHRPLSRLYQRGVSDRLDLDDTHYSPGTAALPPPFAHGYFTRALNGRRERVDTSHWSYSFAASAGAIGSTVADLRRYARALATGHGLLGAAIQARRLHTVNASASGLPGLRYGLGILKLGSFYGHDGSVFGCSALILYSPSERTTVVLLGNTAPELNSSKNTSRALAMWDLAVKLIEAAA